MALPLPGERRLPIGEAVLAALVVLGLCALGCASPSSHMRRVPSSIFQASRVEVGGAHTKHHGDESALLVERHLHAAGLRFGTDGTARALWGYMRTSHRVVDAADARPGDVVFFDTRGTSEELACADHAGVVESVDRDGRIGFVEARGGEVRHSFVDPGRPTLRRGESGQVLNTFLRPKLVGDPDGARYFAGEMLCGVARAEGP
ncbi:MAG TPA: CHAP domain-containing protein [Polyangia bacterium]|nr:CHAP domain-containing protein [Polyangia bacterium]